ncbi:hypothetical protein M0638_12820 [Roseomonas sp. NAR14]|uniref:Secreted protein n=1 Tax=Roseomonas acroporae TaxID=2937791 RepID=A0A9X1Y825_9PROT|nr:hypothetical protein [Roseomonas acroporae]MCK8785268.1 hypothetical protein [Roseomonas acroporae]
MRLHVTLSATLLLALACHAGAALAGEGAEGPGERCRRLGDDDATHGIPASLAPAARRALGLNMSDAEAMRGTVYRCMGGAVLVCSHGANIPCAKGDTGRDLPAAREFCRANPDTDFIPAYVTGHDTVLNWRCQDGRAVASGPGQALDARGFVASQWRPLP